MNATTQTTAAASREILIATAREAAQDSQRLRGHMDWGCVVDAVLNAARHEPKSLAFPHSADFNETKCPHCDMKFYIERETAPLRGAARIYEDGMPS